MSSRMSGNSLPLPPQFSIIQLSFTCWPKSLLLKSFHDSVSVLCLGLSVYPWKLSICCSCRFCAWKGQVWNSPCAPLPNHLSPLQQSLAPSPYMAIRSHSLIWLDSLSDPSRSGLDSRTEIKLRYLLYHTCHWTPWLWLPRRLILLLKNTTWPAVTSTIHSYLAECIKQMSVWKFDWNFHPKSCQFWLLTLAHCSIPKKIQMQTNAVKVWYQKSIKSLKLYELWSSIGTVTTWSNGLHFTNQSHMLCVVLDAVRRSSQNLFQCERQMSYDFT